MSTMTAEVYEALIEAGASEEKAKAAARVVPAGENLATKTDIQGTKDQIQGMKDQIREAKDQIQGMKDQIRDMRDELKDEIQELRTELKVLKFAVFSLYPFILVMTYRLFS